MRLLLLACCLISTLCLSQAAHAADADPALLRVALLPDEDPSTILKNNQALKAHLETALGKRIELVVTPDYTTMIAAMQHGQLELGYFGPLSYVLAKQSCAIEPFACLVKHGQPTYTAVVIAGVGVAVLHRQRDGIVAAKEGLTVVPPGAQAGVEEQALGH